MSPVSLAFRGLAALVFLLSAMQGRAFSQEASPVAVLGLEASDGAPDSVATAVTEALRQKVSGAQGFRLVPGRDLVEVKLVFSCPDEAPSCMAEAGKSLGADKVIFGSVKKAPGGAYLVTLKWLDTKKAKVEAYVAEQLQRSQATGQGARGPAQKWFADLTGRGATGVIRVSADVIGASIILDGLPVGVTRDEALDLESIATGPHEVVISKPGYEPVKRSIVVDAGKVTELEASMAADAPTAETAAASPPPIEASAPGDNRDGLKFAAWSTAGAGLVTAVLGIKFALDISTINSELDPLRRFDCEDGKPECTASGERKPWTKSQQAFVNRKVSEGDTAETMQYVFFGATAVLAATSAYLFYASYADDGGDQVSLVPRLNPYVSSSGSGFSAAWRF